MAATALLAVSLPERALGDSIPDAPLLAEDPSGLAAPTAPRLSLTFEAAPLEASFAGTLGAPVFASLASSEDAMLREAEGQRHDGDQGAYVLVEVLAFILGVVPGFGVGHLIGGSVYGFVTWLCVDLVIGIVLFWVLPILVFPAFPYMFDVSTIAVVVERIFEGYSAFRAAYWSYWDRRIAEPDADPRDVRSRLAFDAAPNLVSVAF
jgi:hypothetical protein